MPVVASKVKRVGAQTSVPEDAQLSHLDWASSLSASGRTNLSMKLASTQIRDLIVSLIARLFDQRCNIGQVLTPSLGEDRFTSSASRNDRCIASLVLRTVQTFQLFEASQVSDTDQRHHWPTAALHDQPAPRVGNPRKDL
jgi:hypothetical protein